MRCTDSGGPDGRRLRGPRRDAGRHVLGVRRIWAVDHSFRRARPAARAALAVRREPARRPRQPGAKQGHGGPYRHPGRADPGRRDAVGVAAAGPDADAGPRHSAADRHCQSAYSSHPRVSVPAGQPEGHRYFGQRNHRAVTDHVPGRRTGRQIPAGRLQEAVEDRRDRRDRRRPVRTGLRRGQGRVPNQRREHRGHSGQPGYRHRHPRRDRRHPGHQDPVPRRDPGR